MKFEMTASAACIELQDKTRTITATHDHHGHLQQLPWSANIVMGNNVQKPKAPQAPTEPEPEIKVCGQPIKQLVRQDANDEVAGALGINSHMCSLHRTCSPSQGIFISFGCHPRIDNGIHVAVFQCYSPSKYLGS